MTQPGETGNPEQGMFLAKALYDNIAETPDELAFRRGDVLTVVEQDASGLEGWWLCSLRGKHGIAPGNRLKILSGMSDSSKTGMETNEATNTTALQDYDVPKSNLPVPAGAAGSPRRGSHGAQQRPDSRPGSRKASLANSDVYDTPPSSKWASIDSCASGGVYDTPPSSKRASSERTPPHSNRSSAASRDSRDSNLVGVAGLSSYQNSPSQSLHQLNLPASALQHRRPSGGSLHSLHSSENNCYDTPPGSNRSSLERILSEEGPPIYESLSPTGSTENLPTNKSGNVSESDPTYDVPTNRDPSYPPRQPPRALPPRQTSRPSISHSSLNSAHSTESLLSNTSGVSSARLSHATSLPDSARSSMDLPSDTYDVPSSAHQHDKQLSTDSGLGFYDSPVKPRPASSNSATNFGTPPSTSNSGTLKSSQSYSRPSPSPSSNPKDMKRSRSLENTLDDCYDTPKNNAPKLNQKQRSGIHHINSSISRQDSEGVYDIPPQVTRDSVISARSDSSNEDNQRLSSSSLECDRVTLDYPLLDVLPLDLDSALEVLVKRQQDVSKATSRLASFVTDDWRSRTSLEKKLYDIKVACNTVRTSLYEFVQFSLKSLSNAANLPDRQLASRIQKQVSPLQSTLEFVNKSFNNLEEAKWQVALLCEPFPKNKPDDLGQIALVAKDLLPEVKRLASFIQSHSETLFKRSSDFNKCAPATSSKPPKGPALNTNNKQKVMQHRPLPAVPDDISPSKQTSSPGKLADVSSDMTKLSLYDIKSALHQGDYVECDELPHLTSPGLAEKLGQNDLLLHQLSNEYDYVELDHKDDPELGSGDVGTLKAPNRCKPDEESKLVKSDVNTCSYDVNDVDLIPVRDNAHSEEEKTPTSKTSGFESTSSFNSEHYHSDVSLQHDQEMKTPVNVTEREAFVLPPPTSSAQSNEEKQNGSNIVDENEFEDEDCVLDPNDRQVLVFYADKMSSHATLLANATDAFLGVVSRGEPPNVFISNSKFVIVSAHKLVHIGDSIHRSLASNRISASIMQCANSLCDCLKASVTATKTAALQYPSGPAIQEMVDRVMAVSHAAHELRLVITQAIK